MSPAVFFVTGLSCYKRQQNKFPKYLNFSALKKTSFKWNATGAASAMCRKARLQYGLARRQTKLCRTSTQTMPHIAKAAAQTVTTCQSVFADRRWNCSSVEMAPSFTPDITTGKFLQTDRQTYEQLS